MTRRLIREPIYQQLNQALRDLLRSGEFKVGDQFLTERQVGERFDVSRGYRARQHSGSSRGNMRRGMRHRNRDRRPGPAARL